MGARTLAAFSTPLWAIERATSKSRPVRKALKEEVAARDMEIKVAGIKSCG